MKSLTELRALDITELNAELLVMRKEQLNQRLRQANGSLDKPHVVKLVRRSIAQIKTIMTQKAGM
jgi:large subunit ribosomal protein L29